MQSKAKRKLSTFIGVLSLIVVAFLFAFYSKPDGPPSFYGKTMLAEAFYRAEAPVRGNEKGSVELTVFCDYTSLTCRSLQPILLQVLEEEPATKWLHKDYPYKGKTARLAAESARCAGKQNAFWEYHDLLYQTQADWLDSASLPFFRGLANELNLNLDEFNACLDFGAVKDTVTQDLKEARKVGIYTAPTVLVNNTLIEYPYDLERLEKAVKYELSR